jgi:hypothetical protein
MCDEELELLSAELELLEEHLDKNSQYNLIKEKELKTHNLMMLFPFPASSSFSPTIDEEIQEFFKNNNIPF